MSVSEFAHEASASEVLTPTIRAPATTRLRLTQVRGYGPIVRALASRDLKARYKQSALGPAWTVFQPLALLAAFSVGFRSVAHVKTGGVPYVPFALVGLAIWSYVQAVLMLSAGSIVNNYVLVRWTACPRLALPLAALVSNLPSFGVPLIAAVVAAAVTGYLGLPVLVLPVLIVWMFVLIAAIATFLAALTVRARDILSALPFLLQVTLFLSPIAYATNQLPPVIRTLVYFNPLSGLIDAWRWSLLGTAPQMAAVVISLVMTVLGAFGAWRVFALAEAVMADEI